MPFPCIIAPAVGVPPSSPRHHCPPPPLWAAWGFLPPAEDTAGAAPQPETAAAACAPGDPAEVAGGVSLPPWAVGSVCSGHGPLIEASRSPTGDIDEVGDPEEACNEAEAVGAEEEEAAAEDEGEEEEVCPQMVN